MLGRGVSLICAAAMALVSTSTSAKVVDLKLADILKDFDATTTTRIGENQSEISQADLGFVIRGGGSLVLCEGGQLGTAGPGGSCKSNDPVKDTKGGTTGSISDLLAFVAGDKNKTITLYSDPTFNNIDLAPAGLKAAFGPYLAYVEEGHYFDERNGNSGLITDAVDTTVYIRSAKSFDRAFVIGSDTTEREAAVPELSTWMLLLLGFGLVGVTMRRGRQQQARPVARRKSPPLCAWNG
jgi:hypothetical protein